PFPTRRSSDLHRRLIQGMVGGPIARGSASTGDGICARRSGRDRRSDSCRATSIPPCSSFLRKSSASSFVCTWIRWSRFRSRRGPDGSADWGMECCRALRTKTWRPSYAPSVRWSMNRDAARTASPSSALLDKYDVPVPRYTSYPTVPYWSDDPTSGQWLEELRRAAAQPDATWAIYIHIPFCESLCTFCGCNTVITRNHGREEPCIRSIHAECSKYLEEVPELARRPLRQLHLGGGTPTFLSPESLRVLLDPLLSRVRRRTEEFDASVEVNPRVTTAAHLA